VSSCRPTVNTACRCSVCPPAAPGGVIDCPPGVAPERMPKADATGLAPKKSADRTLPHTNPQCGRVWFLSVSGVIVVSFKPNALHPRTKSARKETPFLWWNPWAEALGLKREDRPAALAGRSASGFRSSCQRDTRSCLHKRVSYPTRTPSPAILRCSGRKRIREITRELPWDHRGNELDPLHQEMLPVQATRSISSSRPY